MTLEDLVIVAGNLLAYSRLKPGSFQHADEITNLRRTHPDPQKRKELRENPFYTADGELYTVQKGNVLWGITRLPQNLVLQNLPEAYRQLNENSNYFPPVREARVSFGHRDTVVIDVEGLELEGNNSESGRFDINPRNVRRLNSERRKAARRIYGPDQESFGLNMEMFAKAGKSPLVYCLLPEYVQEKLKEERKKFLGRASWLYGFSGHSGFGADDRGAVNLRHDRLPGGT